MLREMLSRKPNDFGSTSQIYLRRCSHDKISMLLNLVEDYRAGKCHQSPKLIDSEQRLTSIRTSQDLVTMSMRV